MIEGAPLQKGAEHAPFQPEVTATNHAADREGMAAPRPQPPHDAPLPGVVVQCFATHDPCVRLILTAMPMLEADANRGGHSSSRPTHLHLHLGLGPVQSQPRFFRQAANLGKALTRSSRISWFPGRQTLPDENAGLEAGARAAR
ncbi:hypothetical protein Purlil1_11925 [Purpureocillium lilacinum]|uniref:Uncharacterized protein n=1 Tax=Purpureocillium lilacinum TaxID=33203 RepID=A0ABR0BI86_PURLI|nr:hypothetical protein Purlil1_11925 [Purpureocillium lilacinum]